MRIRRNVRTVKRREPTRQRRRGGAAGQLNPHAQRSFRRAGGPRPQRLRTCDNARNSQRPVSDVAAAAAKAARRWLRPRRSVLQPYRIFACRKEFSCHARPLPTSHSPAPNSPAKLGRIPPKTAARAGSQSIHFLLRPPHESGPKISPPSPASRAATGDRSRSAWVRVRRPVLQLCNVIARREDSGARASRPQQLQTCESAKNLQRPGSDAAAAAGTSALLGLRLRRPVSIASLWSKIRLD